MLWCPHLNLTASADRGEACPSTLLPICFKIFTGIPLLLVFTAQIGDLMAESFRWMYSRICCRWCRVRRRDNELPPTGMKPYLIFSL